MRDSCTGFRSRKESGVFGWSRSRISENTEVRVGFYCPTPEVQLNHFLHHTPKLGIPVEMVQFLLKLLLKQNCCVPRFPLMSSCYKIVDRQTSKESESDILEKSKSDMLPLTPQPCSGKVYVIVQHDVIHTSHIHFPQGVLLDAISV